MNQEEKDLSILNTIYDEVIPIGHGRYAIKLNGLKGLTDKITGIAVDSIYKQAIYRDNYGVFYGSDKAEDKVIFFNTNKEIKPYKMSNSVEHSSLTEYSEVNFSLVEVITEENNKQCTLFNTDTGEEILSYGLSESKSWRPYNNDIILSVSDGGDFVGINKKLETGKIPELLGKMYKTVEIKKGRQGGYICTDKSGNITELNKFGQIY